MLQILRASLPSADVPVLDGPRSWLHYYWLLSDTVGFLIGVQRRYGRLLVMRERIPLRSKVRNCLVISGADLNRQVLGDPETFASGGVIIRGPRGSALNNLRRGMLTVNGQRHDEQRRAAGPMFMPKAVREFFPNIVATIERELDGWQVGTTVDLCSRASHMVMQLSAQHLLAGGDPDQAFRLANATIELMRYSFARKVMMFPVNLPGTPYNQLLKRAERLQNDCLQMIDGHNQTSCDAANYLDTLIESRRADPQRISRTDLAGQLAVLLTASHETSAKAIVWSQFLLAQHPRICAELQAELTTHCGSDPPSFDDLAELPLLNAVTKEAMRILPPVPMVPRSVRREAMVGPLPVRAGDYIIVNHYASHHDPDVFPNPEQFRPERWFDSQPDNYAYLPFSAGPRACIAKLLGNTIVKMAVARMVQRFRLTVVPHSRISRSHCATMAPRYGMPMLVEQQDGRFQATPIRGDVCEMVDLTRQGASTQSYAIAFPTTLPPAHRRAA